MRMVRILSLIVVFAMVFSTLGTCGYTAWAEEWIANESETALLSEETAEEATADLAEDVKRDILNWLNERIEKL